MKLYDGIKDVAKIVQKANNIELYQQLIDLSAQALDMQDKIQELTKENKELKNKEDMTKRIVRHKETYLTLENDKDGLMYCSCCWDNDKKLIQLRIEDEGDYSCYICKNQGYYNKEMYQRYVSSLDENNSIY
ncbi:MAG: hypothetical protein PHP54_04070 [Clostridia bacterium]|nr:hypothetical protein [Clostridia bacterium]